MSDFLEPGKLYCFKDRRLKFGSMTHIAIFHAKPKNMIMPVTTGPTGNDGPEKVVWHHHKIDPIQGWDDAKAAVFLFVETVQGGPGDSILRARVVDYHLFLYGDVLISFGAGDINQSPESFLDKITAKAKK